MEILGNLSDKLGQILLGFTTISLFVLALVEVLGRTFKRLSGPQVKLILSFILGPLFGLLGWRYELITVALHGDDLSAYSEAAHHANHAVTAALLGFIGTVIAKFLHDGATGNGVTGKLRDAVAGILKAKKEGA